MVESGRKKNKLNFFFDLKPPLNGEIKKIITKNSVSCVRDLW